MKLADQDRSVAAAALCDALPSWEDRSHVVRAAGLGDVQVAGDPTTAWRVIVAEADEAGRVPQLVEAAVRRAPSSAALRTLRSGVAAGELPAYIEPDGARRRRSLQLLAGVVAFWVVGGLAWWLLSPSGTEPEPELGEILNPAALEDGGVAAAPAEVPEPEPAPAREPEPVPEPAPEPAAEPEPEPAPEPDPEPEPAAEPAPTPEPAPAPEPEPTPEPEPEPAPEPAPRPQITAGVSAEAGEPTVPAHLVGQPFRGCAGLSGWAWMGLDGTAVAAGEGWSPERAVNVRAEYPQFSNDYSPRTEVLCVLPRETTATLPTASLVVEGGALWAPIDGDQIVWGRVDR